MILFTLTSKFLINVNNIVEQRVNSVCLGVVNSKECEVNVTADVVVTGVKGNTLQITDLLDKSIELLVGPCLLKQSIQVSGIVLNGGVTCGSQLLTSKTGLCIVAGVPLDVLPYVLLAGGSSGDRTCLYRESEKKEESL